jgi:hypothetical protein
MSSKVAAVRTIRIDVLKSTLERFALLDLSRFLTFHRISPNTLVG